MDLTKVGIAISEEKRGGRMVTLRDFQWGSVSSEIAAVFGAAGREESSGRSWPKPAARGTLRSGRLRGEEALVGRLQGGT